MSAILQPLAHQNKTNMESMELPSSNLGEATGRIRPVAKMDAEAIKAANRLQDLPTTVVTVFVIFCIVASLATLILWAGYSVASELSSWSLQDFMNGVHGGK